MFEAKLNEASLFKKIIDSIKDSVKLCNINCSKSSGVTVQAIDDSRVLLIALKMDPGCFAEFRCDRDIVLGLDLEALSKVLKQGNNDDFLTLMADDQPDNLSIVFEDKKKDKISEFQLKLMDIETDPLTVEDMECDSMVTMPSAEFAKLARDMKSLSEALEIVVIKDSVTFKAKGQIGEGNIVYKSHTDVEHPEESISITMTNPINLSFGAKYLNDIVKASTLSPTITLRLTTEAPALYEFKLPSGYLRFYLAPKFDEDE